jgi:hypothetical protein
VLPGPQDFGQCVHLTHTFDIYLVETDAKSLEVTPLYPEKSQTLKRVSQRKHLKGQGAGVLGS